MLGWPATCGRPSIPAGIPWLAAPVSRAQDPEPNELSDARKNYEIELWKAIKPVKERYVPKLEELKKQLTFKGGIKRADVNSVTRSLVAPPGEWGRRYSGPGTGNDSANGLAVDKFGNAYLTGFATGSNGTSDYVTIKYDASGIQKWVRRYNAPGGGDDAALAIAVDGNGSVYITGWSNGGSSGDDYATIKYDTNGTQKWVRRYNGAGNRNDSATAMTVDKAGNVYVTGQSNGAGSDYDYATIKYDTNGVQKWVRRYSGPGSGWNYATGIAVDSIGNVYVTGRSQGGSSSDDYATIKYDTNGVKKWVRTYNGPGNGHDCASAIAVDGTGNVYVTGSATGTGRTADYATIKYNTNGVQKWVRRYNGPGNGWDQTPSIAVDSSESVYVTGGSGGVGSWYDYATIKYDTKVSRNGYVDTTDRGTGLTPPQP
jgi:hypothetical protein